MPDTSIYSLKCNNPLISMLITQSIVYMAAQDNNMYVSVNSGASWTRIQTETYLSLPFVKAVSSLDGSYGLGSLHLICF